MPRDAERLTPEERKIAEEFISELRKNGDKFVRSRYELAVNNPRATGLVLEIDEVLEVFGLEVVFEVWDKRTAIINRYVNGLEETLIKRREFLGLSPEELALRAGLTVQMILGAEAGMRDVSIHTVVAMAKVLGLNSRYLSWKMGKPELGYLYEED